LYTRLKRRHYLNSIDKKDWEKDRAARDIEEFK
jgi:hypothetical protein